MRAKLDYFETLINLFVTFICDTRIVKSSNRFRFKTDVGRERGVFTPEKGKELLIYLLDSISFIKDP